MNKNGCVHSPGWTVYKQDWMCAWSRVDCTNKIGCVHGPEHTVHEQDWMCA